MRFVATKTPEQQGCLMLHRSRHLFIRKQTSVINPIRAHLAEFGIVAPVGRNGVEQLLDVVADASDKRLSEVPRLPPRSRRPFNSRAKRVMLLGEPLTWRA
jgi:transposase